MIIAALQIPPISLDDVAAVVESVDADVIVFPEYSYLPPLDALATAPTRDVRFWDRLVGRVLGALQIDALVEVVAHYLPYRRFIRAFSSAAQDRLLIATTLRPSPRGLYNTCYVFGARDVVGRQDKLHPLSIEQGLGIRPGQRLSTFEWQGRRFGVAICNDVNPYYTVVDRITEMGADVVLSPSGGWQLPGMKWSWDRDMRHVATSRRTGATIIRSYYTAARVDGLHLGGRSSVVQAGRVLGLGPSNTAGALFYDDRTNAVQWRELKLHK